MSKISFSVCGDFMHPPFYYPFFQYVDRLFLTFNANFERDSYLGPLFIVLTRDADGNLVSTMFFHHLHAMGHSNMQARFHSQCKSNEN